MKRNVKILIEQLHRDIGSLADSHESRKCLDGIHKLRKELNYPAPVLKGAHLPANLK